jgi:hypothetical protein
MLRNIRVIGVIGSTVVLTIILGSAALAIGKPILAPYPVQEKISVPPNSSDMSGTSSTGSATASSSATAKPSQTVTPPPTASPGISTVSGTVNEQLSTIQLEVCQQRAVLIDVIMKRTVTRDQNQLSLFTNIATRVEGFYASKGKAIANYSPLVATVNGDETQAKAGLTTLQGNATFSCEGNNPSGEVSVYQTDFKALQTNIQNLQTAVKNLIVAVAQAEGYSLSPSATKGGQ